jgi:hypothetical protein
LELKEQGMKDIDRTHWLLIFTIPFDSNPP